MSINNETRFMLDMLPSWMKMRQDPESFGAKFLNPVGAQLEELNDLIENVLSMEHLGIPGADEGNVNMASVDKIYKVSVEKDVMTENPEVYGKTGDIVSVLEKASTIYEFYKNQDKYYLDPDSYVLYTRLQFDAIYINEAAFTDIIEHDVWGVYDEIGLLLGCPRLQGERNMEYRERLYDVFKNPGNSTRNGLGNYISRSLGIPKESVRIEELNEEFVSSLINPDGTIKPELKEYVSLSNKVNTSESNIYWEILEESKAGIDYLPMVWNVPLDQWDEGSLQNGIGDTNDLFVEGPAHEDTVQRFVCHVGVEGLKTGRKKIYPRHEFRYRLFATGHKYEEGYAPENYKYSVIASEKIPLRFKVKAHKEYSHEVETDFSGTSVTYLSVTDADKKKEDYITRGTVIQSGSKVMSPDRRYIEILANLYTTDKSSTPVLNSVTLGYKDSSGNSKSLVISGNEAPAQTGIHEITTGFGANTWTDDQAVIKVRSDTNDQYRIQYDNGMKLTKSEYRKVYDSEGDWSDGDAANLRITSAGTLRLSI